MKALFSLLVFLFIGTAAHADFYRTSTGAIFSHVNDPGFGFTWKEPDVNGERGKIWSHYQGDFDNNAISPDDGSVLDDRGGWRIVESHATQACEKIHGRLPSTADFKRLMSFFEIGGGAVLTEQGRKDLQHIFPGSESRWYWSEFTTGPDGANQAQGLNGYTGFVDYYGHKRDVPAGVICIH